MKRKAKVAWSVGMGVIVLIATAAALPLGFPSAKNYFDPLGQRQLQEDEIGQLKSIDEHYFRLSNTGDDFSGWNTEWQDFWKYTLAFTFYGLPSAMLIDPENREDYKVLMDALIWKMKSRKVWGDFTDRGFGSDPISQQNIMYKGHLNLMFALYQLTTGDFRYAREYTWLTQQIAEEMRLHHQGYYEGVTCEPNAWFVECNTVGMLSLHIYDKLYGTDYTGNEVQWSLEFIMQRMRDKETGLFYRAYHPQHDTVRKQLSGYANAWILTFLNPLVPESMADLYPEFKEHLTVEFGPYASIYKLASTNSEPDRIAHIFGLWAAKEFNDSALFGKLRNTADKFGRLDKEASSGGMHYKNPDNLLVNGVILASKLHLGWETLLARDWGHKKLPYPIPDVQHLTWRDILPARIYAMNQSSALPEAVDSRPCPNCFWGDYQSVRMQLHNQGEQSRSSKVCPPNAASGCGLDQLLHED